MIMNMNLTIIIKRNICSHLAHHLHAVGDTGVAVVRYMLSAHWNGKGKE